MTGIGGLGSATNALTTQHVQSLNAMEALQSLSNLNAAGGVSSLAGTGLSQSTASISALGQLFSNLNQLETQNPTQFKQTVAQIATELQTAAQQQTGSSSQFLSQLATNLQEAATTGSLSNIQHNHHANNTQSYNSGGQLISSGVGTDAQSNSNASIQQLFVTLGQQVGAALNI